MKYNVDAHTPDLVSKKSCIENLVRIVEYFMTSVRKTGTKSTEKINTLVFILNPLNNKTKKNNINPVLDKDSNIIKNDKEIINVLKNFSLKFEFSARQTQKIDVTDNMLALLKTP